MLFKNLQLYGDNQLHCLFSMTILLFIFCTYEFINPHHRVNGIIWAFCSTFLIGLVKEMYDMKWGSGFSTMDLVYDFLGMAFAIIILFTSIKIN